MANSTGNRPAEIFGYPIDNHSQKVQRIRVKQRYDCSHGFSHIDTYDIKGNQKKTELNLSFESALSYADWDINENWLKYTQKFLRGEKL